MRRYAGVGALLLFVLALLRQWASWAHWHVDDDLANLGWAIDNRDQPWVALTELQPLHDHVRPATLIFQWLGAQLGQGSWAGVHAVHVVLGALGVLSLALLAARERGLGVAALAALLFLVQPAYGELAWWNAWMCSAGELAFGLLGLALLSRDLERARWPWRAALCLMVAGLFKEPGWVIYPLAGAAMALAYGSRAQGSRARSSRAHGSPSPQRWAAMLGLPALGAAGFALTFHQTNVARIQLQQLDLLQAVGDWSDPLFGEAPTHFAGAALPLPLLALALLTRAGLPPWGAALAALPLWGLGLSPEWRGLSLLLLLGVALIGAAWRRELALGVLLAVLSFGVMMPFAYPHPVQVIAGFAGLSIATATGLLQVARSLPRWGQSLMALAVMACVGLSASRQPRPLHGPWPNNRAMERQQLFLGALAIAQQTGATHVNSGPDDAVLWQLARLGGLEVRGEQPGQVAIALRGADLSGAYRELSPNLLEGLTIRNKRRSRPRGRDHTLDPTLTLEAGLYVLAIEGEAGPELGLALLAEGNCGRYEVRSAGGAAVHAQPILLRERCALSILLSSEATGEPLLYALPMPRLSLREARTDRGPRR